MGRPPLYNNDQVTLKRHETSKCHNAADMLEASLCMSREDGGIQEAFAAVESAERKLWLGS